LYVIKEQLLVYEINYLHHTTNEDIADPSATPTPGSKTANINVKQESPANAD